jgi:hypothetical protein
VVINRLALLLTVVIGTSFLSASGSAQELPYVVPNVDCHAEEHVKAILDHAYIAQNKDETIFIIARLGTGETSRRLNQRRLYAPSQFLIETRGTPKDKLVAAEGERVKGPGQVELYVNGKLYAVFKMKRHRDFVQSRYCRPNYH